MQTRGHSAWAQIYTISTGAQRPLNPISNTFCAGGGWTSNGTLVSVGGELPESTNKAAKSGLRSIRFFTPCTSNRCDVEEYPDKIRLTSNRWYASTVRLTDGSLMIIGGTLAGGFNNKPSTNNPTYEFFPPKGNGLQIPMRFLTGQSSGAGLGASTLTADSKGNLTWFSPFSDSLNTNLFPIVFSMPKTGYLFIAANKLCMIYDRVNKREHRLPGIPNGVVVNYPVAASSVLLPLTIANGFAAEILICGGSTANVNVPPKRLSALTPASSQCIRTKITGTSSSGWTIDDPMPEARIMGDAVLTPDGKVLIVNGAKSGFSGYGNVRDRVGMSNAANPAYSPCLYDPNAARGSRFSTNFPRSSTERVYHSVATLIPDGRIFIAGSNPNGRVTKTRYQTRFNTEFLSPPYMSMPRPSFKKNPRKVHYGRKYSFSFTRPNSRAVMQAFIMDMGFVTHSMHMDQRSLELKVVSISGSTITIEGPAGPTYYAPGFAWLWLLADGIPSKGTRVMIGTGADPPSSAFASKNLLAKT